MSSGILSGDTGEKSQESGVEAKNADDNSKTLKKRRNEHEAIEAHSLSKRLKLGKPDIIGTSSTKTTR